MHYALFQARLESRRRWDPDATELFGGPAPDPRQLRLGAAVGQSEDRGAVRGATPPGAKIDSARHDHLIRPRSNDPEPDVSELAPGPEAPRIEPCLNAKPRWDADLRVLTWHNKPMGAYARPALNQEKILSAFEEEGWPTRIDDPLPPGRLRQTLKDLQKKFKDAPITFRRRDRQGDPVDNPVRLAHAPSRSQCRPPPARFAWAPEPRPAADSGCRGACPGRREAIPFVAAPRLYRRAGA